MFSGGQTRPSRHLSIVKRSALLKAKSEPASRSSPVSGERNLDRGRKGFEATSEGSDEATGYSPLKNLNIPFQL